MKHQTDQTTQHDAQPAGAPPVDMLMARLEAHSLESLGAPRSFVQRLAEENGWTLGYAQRVVVEYRRFVWLAMQGQAVASPSDAVDQAWHLHLCESRDYWGVFCPEVLGAPLHHEPSRGGDAADSAAQYAATLARYRERFGPPPADIWTPTPPVYGPRHLRIALLPPGESRLANWRSKLSGWLRSGPWLSLATLLIASTVLADEDAGPAWMNMLDWRGPAFLTFFFFAMFALAAWLFIERAIWRMADSSATRVWVAKLTPYEVAYLAGGRARASDTALLGLLQRNWARIDGLRIMRLAGDAQPIPRAERLLHGAMARSNHRLAIRRRAKLMLAEIEQSLIEKDLLWDEAASRLRETLIVLPCALLWLMGAAKVWVGMARYRPVGFLMFLMMALSLCLWKYFQGTGMSRRRTALADKTLAQLGTQYAEVPEDEEAARFRLAVFGTIGLASSNWAYASAVLQPVPTPPGAGVSGDSGSSCSSGGCGGGGGGCGGCGGGD